MSAQSLDSKRILIFGGTGSLGTTLTRRLLKQNAFVGIFSRDEAKNFHHRRKFAKHQSSLRYFVGDVRNYGSVLNAIMRFKPHIVINAAAMKQVPLCESFPEEAVQTNVIGTQNVAQGFMEFSRTASGDGIALPLQALSISTDKAVKPINAYGATKALQERIHLNRNDCMFPTHVVANCVRYGNVLESTGSVVPVFKAQLAAGQKLTVTDPRMTRFLLSLDEAVDLIFTALRIYAGGKIFVPELRSARIIDVAAAMCRDAGLDPDKTIDVIGIRPGEKLHELLISEEECSRVTFEKAHRFFSINSFLPTTTDAWTENQFSSGDPCNLVSQDELEVFLRAKGVIEGVSKCYT